jgi:hypothetical protein
MLYRLISFGLILLVGVISVGAEPMRLPVIRDNSIVMVDGEWHENAGEQGRIRIKGNQHEVAIAFDLSLIRGKRVKRATLVCFKGEETLSDVTLSTIATAWDETRSTALSCGIDGIVDWGYPGARFPAVTGGNGFTLVKQSPSEVRDEQYYWDVDPDMIHAMAIGCAHGLAIHEHDANYGRNPTIFSREQSSKKPYLLVELDEADEAMPQPPTELRVSGTDGESLRLQLKASTVGFAYEVTVNGQSLGRHNIPFVEPGAIQTIPIRDLSTPIGSGEAIEIQVVTIGRTGKRSSPVQIRSIAPKHSPVPQPQATFPQAVTPVIPGIAAIPLTDKYDQSGQPVGDLPDEYRSHNAIFNGQRIQLVAAAGEVVGFQLLVRGQGEQTIQASYEDSNTRIDLHHAVYVPANGRLVPDPLLPLPQKISLNPDSDQVVVADIYVPFDSTPGIRKGSISVSDGRKILFEIDVLPIALPRRATFFCEMNGYGLPDHVKDYYAHQRIAYDHRVHANILHYSHNTAAPGARKSNLDMRMLSGRRMDNKRYDNVMPEATTAYWDDFVEAFGPYIDGSIFADGHRGPVPAPGFYLTFHESWPLNCRAFFNGNPDAYKAFSDQPAYARTYVNVLQDFAQLAQSKSWTQTGFQVYFNNKGSLAEKTKAPWILDEPSSFWDYRALQFYGELTDRGRKNSPEVKIDYRVDISRPEYCRSQLDGRGDLWVVSSSAFQQYSRLVTDRIERDGLKAWIYGTSNHVHQSNRNIQAWALDAWKEGATGIVPWQTVNKSGSALKEADQLGLFIYDQDPSGEMTIHHSLRLKAYREAQQLIEYLNLLKARRGWSQESMRQFVSQYVDLSLVVTKVNEADAGTSSYAKFSELDVDRLRLAMAALLRNDSN